MHPSEAEFVEWDEHNESHLARHAIDPVEVDDVVQNGPTWLSNGQNADDWKAIGLDRGGRLLTIICRIDEVRRSMRPITGWTATADEANRYWKGRGR